MLADRRLIRPSSGSTVSVAYHQTATGPFAGMTVEIELRLEIMTTPDGTTRRIVIDHVDLLVGDLEASRDFYRRVLAPLGFHEMDRGETFSAYGIEGSADFAINLVAPGDQPTSWAHVAFVADSRVAVDAFFQAALTAGAQEKQSPAEHPEYHEGYYSAFVYDLDGNNIEAVFHDRRRVDRP